MSTTAAPKTGFVSGETSETIEANRILQEALAKLSQSLDTRKNRFFDPTWLAAAQGFLAPTQTGGFGESLGNAAKSISAAQEQEIKNEQEIAQQRVAAAGKGVELQRMRSQDADVANWLGGSQPAGPLSKPPPQAGPLSVPVPKEPAAPDVATAAPVSAPSALSGGALPAIPGQALKGALSGNAEDDGGVQIFPPNPSFMSAKDFVRLNRNSGKSLADLLKEGQELERKNLEVKESGTTNLASGKFYPNKAAPLDIQIFGEGYDGKTFSIPESVALELSVLQRQGNAAGYKALADKFTGKSFGASAPVSKEERAIAAERAKTLAAADTAQEVEARKDFDQRKKDADETITVASVFRRFASDPNAKDMVGILNNNKISSGLATLLQSGVGSINFRIGVPEIENVMRNANLSDEAQAKYRTFLMYAAQMQLQQAKYMKGSVSDFEQRLMGSAGINNQDTPESIRIKADLLTRRAQFDRRAAKAFKDSKLTANEFVDSDKYNEMRDKYNEDLADLASGSKVLVIPPPAAAAPGSAPSAPGQPSVGFIRDPKTGVIRRKRAGE